MENPKEILNSVLRVLIAQQRELDSLTRVVAAIRSALDPAEAQRMDNELALLFRTSRPTKDVDSELLRIEQMLEQTR